MPRELPCPLRCRDGTPPVARPPINRQRNVQQHKQASPTRSHSAGDAAALCEAPGKVTGYSPWSCFQHGSTTEL